MDFLFRMCCHDLAFRIKPRRSPAAAMAGTRTAALLVLVCLHFHRSGSFNLDVDNPYVYSRPEGSYFGFSVDFFKPSNNLQ
uniref:Uncharacterized protein n=1 Tax=Neolamprologus brichardi TaxID=32507 RepID=A0A3Q4GEA9_NEOBR